MQYFFVFLYRCVHNNFTASNENIHPIRFQKTCKREYGRVPNKNYGGIATEGSATQMWIKNKLNGIREVLKMENGRTKG